MQTLSVTPMISVRPNRVTLTKLVRKITLNNFLQNSNNVNETSINIQSVQNKSVAIPKKLEKKFHEFEISKNSQRNLRDKISYLFQFARGRNIKTYSGKTIPNFKVCFLTLTLPSKQVHPTNQINSECLDNFLQVLRQRLKMSNYVWRLEFQSNGNVHYHIATDTYIDYFFAQKHWNAIINKLGYVDAYAKKMDGMQYHTYKNKYYSNSSVSNDVIYKRWVKGKACKWSNPNSVDVKNAKSSDNIGYYISKYFSKKEKSTKCNSLDNESNSFALRLAFWSRSLSKCKSESMPFDYYTHDIVRMFENANEIFCKCYDYAKVWYFSFNELPNYLKSFIGSYFNTMVKEISYVPA